MTMVKTQMITWWLTAENAQTDGDRLDRIHICVFSKMVGITVIVAWWKFGEGGEINVV